MGKQQSRLNYGVYRGEGGIRGINGNEKIQKKRKRLNYKRRAHITHTRHIPRTPSSEDQGNGTAGSHRILTYKATSLSLGVIMIYLIHDINIKREPKWGHRHTHTDTHTEAVNERTGGISNKKYK